MDIAKLSTNMSQINTASQFGVAMLSKQLDTNEQMGASLIDMMDKSMMERSVMPHIGSNFDASV